MENDTHPNIKAVVIAYALRRDNVSCSDCTASYLAIIQDYTSSQDKIGWGNFMMGMVSTKMITIQKSHLQVHGSLQLPDRWATGFITLLLQVSHAQWIYRCLLVHNCSSGMIINLHKTELLEEIASQLSLGVDTLLEDDKYLLKGNLMDLATTNGEQQEYQLLAIKAARKACLLHHPSIPNL